GRSARLQGVQAVGAKPERRAEVGDGAVGLVPIEMGEAALVERLDEAGGKADGGIEVPQCPIEGTLRTQCLAARLESVRVVRVETQRRVEIEQGAVDAPKMSIGPGAIAQGFGIVEAQMNGGVEVADRVLVLALACQRPAPVVEGLGVVRIEAQ